jgi:ABC-type phosphate/phosphonate transport system substrate-binding protein
MGKRSLAILIAATLFILPSALHAAEGAIICWFPPGWKAKQSAASAIAKSLSEKSGLAIRSQVAESYPQILEAFSSDDPSLVFVGSFVQAVIAARGLGSPLAQSINGKELYSGIMVYPKGGDPEAILRDSPAEIAYTRGASSGESSAKAATGGEAAIPVKNHGAASQAVVDGQAKAAVVKNWWWEANKGKFPGLAVYKIPGVSIQKNPDNVLTASKAISNKLQAKITAAAVGSQMVFGGDRMVKFDPAKLSFSLELMKKGNIDPLTYTWK